MQLAPGSMNATFNAHQIAILERGDGALAHLALLTSSPSPSAAHSLAAAPAHTSISSSLPVTAAASSRGTRPLAIDDEPVDRKRRKKTDATMAADVKNINAFIAEAAVANDKVFAATTIKGMEQANNAVATVFKKLQTMNRRILSDSAGGTDEVEDNDAYIAAQRDLNGVVDDNANLYAMTSLYAKMNSTSAQYASVDIETQFVERIAFSFSWKPKASKPKLITNDNSSDSEHDQKVMAKTIPTDPKSDQNK
jgi:hypothetical protein